MAGGAQIEGLEDLNHQLFMVLTQMTEGDPNDIVSNSGESGLEAWRKLQRRYDPSTGGRARNLLRYLIKPGRVKVEDLAGALERWEEKLGRYLNSRDRKCKKKGDP